MGGPCARRGEHGLTQAADPPHLCAAMQLATVKLRYATNLAGNPKLRGESEK